MSGLGMVAGGRRPDSVFLSAAKKTQGRAKSEPANSPARPQGGQAPEKKEQKNSGDFSNRIKKGPKVLPFGPYYQTIGAKLNFESADSLFAAFPVDLKVGFME